MWKMRHVDFFYTSKDTKIAKFNLSEPFVSLVSL